MSKIIVGIDIGTSSIKGALWRRGGKGNSKGSIFWAEHPIDTGIQKGVIRDVDEVSNRLSSVVEELERMSGESIRQVIVSVGGVHLESRFSKGSVIVSRADRIVSREDVQRALDIAKGMATIPNRRIIHSIPRFFSLDGVGGISNPVDMEGYHLDVETFIIDGLLPAMSALEKTFELLDIRPEMMVAGPLAGSRAALSRRDREEGIVAIDIGASTTSLAVFEEDNLLHIAVLQYGSHDITRDIAVALKLPIETAENLKCDFGSAIVQGIDKREMVLLSRYLEGVDESISRRYLVEIIEAKAEEIFDFIAEELRKINRFGKLPGGAIIFGGGAKLRGIEVLSKKVLKMSSRIATFEHLLNKFPNPPGLQFFNTCGLILWGMDELGEIFLSASYGSYFLSKLKTFFRNFLP